MNQSTNTSDNRESCSLLTYATEDEIIVSQILLDLKKLMSLSESLANFNWNCKRRRSCLDAAPPLSRVSSWLSPSVENTIEERRAHIKAGEVVLEENRDDGGGRTTDSPDTPLSFLPSDESDEKSKYLSKKSSKKLSKEAYLDMIEEQTQRKNLLRGEIENVKRYHSKLKARNAQLKAMKQEVLNSSLRKEEARMEISGVVNIGMGLTQHYQIRTVPHQQPFIANPTVQELQCPYIPFMAHSQPSDNPFESVNHVGPLGLDLNLPAEEALGLDQSQPLDVSKGLTDKRARFAEARRKRRGIMKTKCSRNGV